MLIMSSNLILVSFLLWGTIVDGFSTLPLQLHRQVLVLGTGQDQNPQLHVQVQAPLQPFSSDDLTTDASLEAATIRTSLPINPLVVRVLQETNPSALPGSETAATSTILHASTGVQIWQEVLLRGRVPIPLDFENHFIWPPEPLFSACTKVMTNLQLPRFVMRHKQVVNVVLMSMLRMAMSFELQRQQVVVVATEDSAADEDNEEELFHKETGNRTDIINADEGNSEDELDSLAVEIASGFVNEYGGVLEGVSALDLLFGYNHGLLDVQGVDAFGIQDGIWQNSGWKVMPTLQRQIHSMTELRDMIKVMGRRPTAENDNDILRRFAPRDLNSGGTMGAQLDPMARNSISGLALSGSLTEMIPSEAGLLLGKSQVFRRLFLAKKVESKLLSYQLSGWSDVPSIPQLNPRYLPRLPAGPAGPIVVCLDTSWSMSGSREMLSKAVVLACVSAARKQGRTCQVVAFSNERGVMDAGEITASPDGVRRLLEFLSNSFGGGTDVTGALKYAMTTLGSDVMSAADLLLITDGEIPDPPVTEELMLELDRLKRRTGMQIHGLLVGNRESKSLSKLCTTTYDFLIGYDIFGGASRPSIPRASSSAMFVSGRNRIRFRSPCTSHVGWGSKTASHTVRTWNVLDCLPRTSVALSVHKLRDFPQERGEGTFVEDDAYELDDDNENVISSSGNADYRARVDQALSFVHQQVTESIQGNLWNMSSLDSEKNIKGSCWRHRDDLQLAVEKVGENLVERNEEARLLVLSMIAGEHILFLGPPGTGKSLLGSRLSKLCGGLFFQRLLTRFTTPEEIFGPLSLRALENDEYKRCTYGYLPTASIAFLDEIFKANSAILNTLLTILNERKFDNGLGVREDCPIKCVVGASNELPESDELDALYDRFLIRKEVLSVSDEGIMKILSMSTSGNSGLALDDNALPRRLPFADGLDIIVSELSNAANSVSLGDDVCFLMRDLRRFMIDELNVEISDRRLVKAARLLKIIAASHGRTSVDMIDCLVLQHVVWRLPEQRVAVREWLWNNLTPSSGDKSSSVSSQFRLLLENLRCEALVAVRKTSGDVTGASGGRAADIAVIRSIHDEVALISDAVKQRLDAMTRHIELVNRALDHMWIERDEALSVQQMLLPKADMCMQELMQTLADARALHLTLARSAIDDDLRLSLIEDLWGDQLPDLSFNDDELSIGMKEAKNRYDIDTFRKWKRARKKSNK